MKPSIIHFDLAPPLIVRALAKTHGRRLSTEQIALLSGLSINTVNRISRCWTWKAIRCGAASAFCHACGHDLMNPERSLRKMASFLRTGKGMDHLTIKEKNRLLKRLVQ